jgi:hyperpolarization activated cyclic nucleotide-gated potassium channel 2
MVNLKIIKLTRLPRLYRLLRLLKLFRLYKSNKFIQSVSMRLNFSITTTRLIKSFVMVLFLIHLIGCVWVTVAALNPFDDSISWISAAGLIDSENSEIYIASIYWAAVSIYTVGYGDITSKNTFEYTCNIVILFIGITIYTYIFS